MLKILCKINVKSAVRIVIPVGMLLLTFYNHLKASGEQIHAIPIGFSDTVPKNPAKPLIDSAKTTTMRDTVKIDTIPISSDSLDAPISYAAEDSGVLMVPNKEFILYGKATTDYKDLKLEAAVIEFNQQTQMVKAFGSTDSTGNPLSKPQFSQGDMKTVSDSIFYNMKNNKGLIKNTFLQEGEIFMNAQTLKKINADESFGKNVRFTTCNLDTPHFAFRSTKMKMINNKLAVTGRVYPEIESIPIEIISLPFGLFPLNRARHSGVLFPTFTASEDFGLGLEGLGYYKVLSDYADITTRANIYSYGGWNLNLSSKYIKRYKLSGNVSVSILNTKTLNRSIYSKEEFNQSKSFMINWSHSRDSRARPGTNFSANVNFGSSKFNQSLQNNPFQNFQNQLASNINYSKDWRGKYNLSVNLNHNQNSNTKLVNLNLPTANFNVVTFYPFEKKERIGAAKWYEKIGIGYNGNLQNLASFYDTAFSMRRLLDTIQWGAQHNLPINLSLPALGPITVAPGLSYEERWYGQRMFRTWDSTDKKVDTTIQKGFYTARQMSFGISFNTRIFGKYNFKPSSNVVAIRHEVRPSISLNYRPDLASGYHYSTQVDTNGTVLRFSQFEGGVLGSFSEGNYGGISFGIDNVLEMKVKDKKDTSAKATKKVKILDGFGFNSSYNLLADSFALGNFSIYARSTLFDKININASANLDPYAVNEKGYRINQILFDPRKLQFGRITSGNIALSTSFKSKTKDGKEADKNSKVPLPNDPFMTPDEQQRELQFIRANPAEFTDFNIPWTLSLSYSLGFFRLLKPDYSGFTTETNSSVNFNGDFSLTEKWKIGGTGFYDITRKSLQQISMFITREMHCWQLSVNVTPVGLYRSFNITINPKSGILRDLRINRSRTFFNQ
jgi:LPS-assembly protein